jgi:hypothetical protein
MHDNLNKTFQYLATTDNESAVGVLISGLDSPYKPTGEGSLRALLRCPNLVAHREVFRRLPTLDSQLRSVIHERPDRLVCIFTEVLRTADPLTHRMAYQMAIKFRLYDAIPTLLSVLVDPANPDPPQTAVSIFRLTEAFYKELSGVEKAVKTQDLDKLRTKITSCLEESVRKYHRHRQKAVIEAFLLLAKTNNVGLHYVLSNPDEVAYEPMLDVLLNSPQGGVKRLLMGYFSKPPMPQAIIRTIGRRCDAGFVSLLAKEAEKTTKNVLESISSIENYTWAVPGHELFEKLDESAQAGAVSLLMSSAIDRTIVGKVIEYLFLLGNAGGRRMAAKALSKFAGPEIDEMILGGLQDDDPAVLASLLVQLRPRNIPGAFERLLAMVDHPHPCVKDALREALPEFCVHRFLHQFDMLPEELRMSTGCLVRKLDPESTTLLNAEMQSPSPARKLRAIEAAGAMGLVSEVESQIIELLADDDHMVRTAAARALAGCKSIPSWEALRKALLDRCVLVQEAVEQSMEFIVRSLSVEIKEVENASV